MAETNTDDMPFGMGGLGSGERFWRKTYPWLNEQGYKLRPRYSPDWKPSFSKFLGSKKSYMYKRFEDGPELRFQQIIDATRISDGVKVALKRIDQEWHPFEVEIMRYLSSDPQGADPRNHSIRLLDVLHLPDDPKTAILVLPLLRDFTSPPFDTVGEVLDCCRQFFEGIQFLHEHRVAHRDINLNNFMLQGEDMFPKRYHFSDDMKLPDLSASAPYFTRTQRPPRYFLIDFGISRRYEAGDDAPLEPVIVGGDRYVPEFKDPKSSQNPFLTDIFCAGNMIRQQFIEGHPVLPHVRGCKGLEFLKPLINDMVQDDPTKRPTIDDVVRRFDDLVNSLSEWRLRSRVVPRRRNAFLDIVHSLTHWRRRALYTVTRTPALPRPKE